jgi:uncharacterized protein (TIGR03437 family)
MNSGSWAASLILAFAGPVISLGTPSEFTTYIGDANTMHVARIRVDSAGNTYVAGNRSNDTLSTMFVAKLDTTGKVISFLAFGGNGTDTVFDMVLDSSGIVYLAGSTNSSSFPLVHPLQAASGPGFVTKLDPVAGQILYSTYFPAAVNALAVDSPENIYVTGTTNSANFPVTPGMPAGVASGGVPTVFAAFVTKISASGDAIVYSARISGSDKPCGCCSSCFLSARNTGGIGIAVDGTGNAYFAGNTDTTNIPTTTGAFQPKGIGAFLGKVKAEGTGLAYLTYVGAANYVVSPYHLPGNNAVALAVDTTGNAYLTGSTADPAFPATPGAYQTVFSGPVTGDPYPPPPTDAFVLKLKPDGTGLVWATMLGGTGADGATAIAVDSLSNVWLAGATASPTFPNAQGWSQGSDFLTGLNANGSAPVYSARYPAGSVSHSLAVDLSGALHAAAASGLLSVISPAASPAPRIFGIANAAYGAIGGQMARGEVISIYGPHIGPATPLSSVPVNGAVPTSLGGIQVLMGSFALPLLFVSDSQINAVAPFSLFGSAAGLSIQVVKNGAPTPLFPFASIDAVPEIFQNSDGSAAAVNQDGTINSTDHPAVVGSTVTIWITGVGSTSAYLQDGQIATGASQYYCCTLFAGFPQIPATIAYSGSENGAVNGVVQINFVVPPQVQLYGPAMDILVAVGAKMSNPVTIHVAN